MAASDLTDSSESDDVEDLLSGVLRTGTSGNRQRRGPFATVLWLLSFVPTVALLLLLSMAARVWITDGAWPERNQPDPKDLGIHNTITVVTILASVPAAILVPIMALAGNRFGSRRTPLGPLLLGIIGFAVLLVVLRADVGGLGDWIGD